MKNLHFTVTKIANGHLVKETDGSQRSIANHGEISQRISSYFNEETTDMQEGDVYTVTVTKKRSGKKPLNAA